MSSKTFRWLIDFQNILNDSMKYWVILINISNTKKKNCNLQNESLFIISTYTETLHMFLWQMMQALERCFPPFTLMKPFKSITC